MGFLRVVNGNEMDAEKLARFWGNTLPKQIENGGRVIVRENEFLVQLSGDSIADIITEAGGYIYHSDIEANPDKEAYDEVFAGFAEKHGGFFGDKEIVILSYFGKITSAEQFGQFLNELAAGKNGQSPEPPAAVPSDSEEMWICGKCGTENNLNYCSSCGASRASNPEAYTEPKQTYIPVSKPETTAPPTTVPSNSEEMWICGDCGTKNKFSYCKNCGASRKTDSEIYTAPKTYVPLSEAKIVEPPPIIPSRSGEMWICDDCGTKNKFSYCKNCGASRKTDSEIYTETEPMHTSFLKMADDMWICENCGTKNKFSFCKSCGSPRPKKY